MVRTLCLAVIGIWSIYLSAQTGADLWRQRVIPVVEDTLTFDTAYLFPGTVSLSSIDESTFFSAADYTLIGNETRLVWINRPATDSVRITYQVFPAGLTSERYHKDTSIINRAGGNIIDPFVYKPGGEETQIVDFGGLDYNGSFSRGIAFGNQQDLSLNSSFNLQLAGEIGDGIQILAALTDENLPIQPEGNTQQLQEFDQVFIQFSKDQHKLTAGDYQLYPPLSYFMKFNKKLQGLKFDTEFKPFSHAKNALTTSVAVARGLYARNNIDGQEGNQGPYRLTGNNGETFIIVMAGTERVFVDGELLIRGDEQDYVIDYNQGEITFTPNRLITKDSRIIVEFEYSVQSYFRSTFFISDALQAGKWTFRVNAFSEQDGKNQPVLEDFTDSLGQLKKQILVNAGDDLTNAVFPGYREAEYNADVVQYQLTDTVVNSILYDSVFVFSTEPDSANYQVSFSLVGQGKGDYRISQRALNGRIYEWVAPVAGVPQGSYAPVIVLIAPNKRQMFTFGADRAFSKGHTAGIEMALSNADPNTFSDIGNADNKGVALQAHWNRKKPFGSADSTKNKWVNTYGAYEFTNKDFVSLDSYRNIEFSRDWSLNTAVSDKRNEHLGRAGIEITGPNGLAGYEFSSFIREGQYTGIRNGWSGLYKYRGFNAKTNGNYLTAQGDAEKVNFWRPQGEISQRLPVAGGLRLGTRIYMEDNRVYTEQTDTLSSRSFKNREVTVFARTEDTSRWLIQLAYKNRLDYAPVSNDFPEATRGETYSFEGASQGNAHSRLAWNLTYRRLDVLDTTLTTREAEDSYLGRLEYGLILLQGFIRTNTLYEVASGQGQKQEFAYLKVPEGQGNYLWIDRNNNNLQELDEFQQASESDLVFANYIRVLTPTAEFIRANITQFNQTFLLDPRAKWRNATGMKKWIARFSNAFVLQLQQKVLANAGFSSINPFAADFADTSLINTNGLIRNTFYFNRFDPKFGMDYTWQRNTTKVILTNGLESKLKLEHLGRIRWNPSQKMDVEITGHKGNRQSSSEALLANNYDFDFVGINPEVSWQLPNVLRLTLGYAFDYKENMPDFGGEIARIHEMTLNGKYNVVNKSTLTGKFSFATIDFNGESQNSLAYAMLEGLQPGNNFIWNLSLDRKLANNIQLTLAYDGKKAGDNAVLHVGRAEVRAVF